MSAVSPYAPHSRNSLLRRRPSVSPPSTTSSRIGNADRGGGSDGSGRGLVGQAAMAVLLMTLGFWRNKEFAHSWVKSLLRRLRRTATQLQLTWTPLNHHPRNNPVVDDANRKEEGENNNEKDNDNDQTATVVTVSPNALSQESHQQHSLKRIAENQRLIQKVLHYWFGQYSPDESQKHLWMIAHSSQTLRDTVDQDIALQFQTILLELSTTTTTNNTNYNDNNNKCSKARLDEPTLRWKEWCGSEGKDDDSSLWYGVHGKIAAIVVLDQFSRHIRRHFQTRGDRSSGDDDDTESWPFPQHHFDEWALHTAQRLIQHHSHELHCGMVPVPMVIFSLMPFRHANTLETLHIVQNEHIHQLESRNHQMEAMLGRFRKATNRRMATLQDEARRSGTARSTISTSSSISLSNPTNAKHNRDPIVPETGPPAAAVDAKNGGDGDGTLFSDEDILETGFFEADMGPARNHPCVKTIQDFLTDRGIRPSNSSHNNKNEDSPTTSVPVIVSLSGGVDSMVIASVLVYLKSFCGYLLDIWAVHIDYANRPESGAEADFVRRYCERLGISFQVRRIGEVTRGVTARDEYERIARDLRYTSYKETIAKATQTRANETIGVMLGHHRGDLRENVLSNAHKGCGPLDLSGMTAVSRNDGVVIYRPLLPLEKTFIFDYAHKFGVPYFKDTTPHWSTRGKLRNQLIPLLEEIYGEGSLKNLSNLAVDSDECRALLQKSMIGPFLDRVKRFPMGIVFETTPWKEQALFFWKVVLREVLHSASFGMFSDKSVIAFLERVQAEEVREGWLQCRRDYAVYLQRDGSVFVLYPSSFPFNKQDIFDVEGQAVAYGEEKRVGPWIVKAEIVHASADCQEPLNLEERALPSMSHLMNGVIEYVVEVPAWEVNGSFVSRPLVFCRFSKASRPAAWKNKGSDENLYLKVQETLPLLGNDKVAQATYVAPTANGCLEEANGEVKQMTMRMARVTLKVDRS